LAALTVKGIILKNTPEPHRHLNERMAGMGDSVLDAKVIELREDGVTVEFQGERRFIAVGRTTM
jgi:hypothetical protein